MKKKLLAFIFAVMAVFAFAVGLVACGGSDSDNGQGNGQGSGGVREAVVPVYSGMTVSQTATKSYNAPLRSARAGDEIEGDGEDGQIPETGVEVPEVDIEDNDFETDIEEEILPSISVDGSDEIEYYAEKNTDIFINVHVNNPSGYVILRFTLNGTIYQNYQFENGSDSERLILKVNTGDACGVKEYTIDAIKYIDDADNLLLLLAI